MRIGFTGHRNRITSELPRIYALYPDATWVHGGAEGFDSQVDQYAKEHGITVEVIRPEYDKYPGKVAPLLRNEDIVNGTDMLVACFDGRKTGGTRYTVEYAKRQGKPVTYLAYMLETTPPVTNRTPEQLEHADRLVWTGIENARRNKAKVNAVVRGNRYK